MRIASRVERIRILLALWLVRKYDMTVCFRSTVCDVQSVAWSAHGMAFARMRGQRYADLRQRIALFPARIETLATLARFLEVKPTLP